VPGSPHTIGPGKTVNNINSTVMISVSEMANLHPDPAPIAMKKTKIHKLFSHSDPHPYTIKMTDEFCKMYFFHNCPST
jgi:hypothetical protein